jgi:hypothetical protein
MSHVRRDSTYRFFLGFLIALRTHLLQIPSLPTLNIDLLALNVFPEHS